MKSVLNKKGRKIVFTVLILALLVLSFFILTKPQITKPGDRPSNTNNSQIEDDLNNKPAKEPTKEVPQEASPAEKLLAQMTLEEKVGQMFIVGFKGTEPDYYIDKMISQRNIGGVILMGHNIVSRQQLITLTNSLQSKSEATNLKIPLIIATDQEGGEILRVKVEGVSEFSAQADIKTKEQALTIALNRGKELKNLGINTNFSPVLDYIDNKKSFLYSRTFQKDLNETSELGSAMIEGYQKNIISAPKHFLGHPNLITDPHLSHVFSDFSPEEINERIDIFKKVSNQSSPGMIMTSHITYNNIDPENPCSLSKACVTNWLKEKTSLLSTVIVTDAMEMGAISNNYTNSEAAVMAIKAGNDILLYTRYPEKQAEAYNSIVEAVNNKEISITQIDVSALKILELKMKYLY